MSALAFTAATLILGLGAYYVTGAVRKRRRAREDARRAAAGRKLAAEALAADRVAAERYARSAVPEHSEAKPAEEMPPRPSWPAPAPARKIHDPRFDPCGAPPVGRRP